ncbi:hypothetical protein NC651_013009 [Populus alba x Populus x berolinensis]|nr:hypothetical protein NC651_013009 [Populus alba x Populus x berolinensis]
MIVKLVGQMNGAFLVHFTKIFKRRFARLLEVVLDPKINYTDMKQEHTLSAPDAFWRSPTDDLSPYDLERLKVYTGNLADFHLILDIVPILARLYFRGKLPVTLSHVSASIFTLCLVLQQRNITFVEAMKKIYKYLRGIASKEIESTLPWIKERELRPHSISVNDDLKEAAKQVEDGMKSKMEGFLNPEFLQQHAIVGREEELENALQEDGGKINPGGVICVKTQRS